MTTHPQATFTSPGLCHRLDVDGSPHAGAVTFRADGAQQVPLSLGDVLGKDAVVNVTSEEYLIGLVDAALFAYSLLHMAHEDQPGCAA